MRFLITLDAANLSRAVEQYWFDPHPPRRDLLSYSEPDIPLDPLGIIWTIRQKLIITSWRLIWLRLMAPGLVRSLLQALR